LSDANGLEKLDNKAADDLNLAWHRLDTWPDTVPGFVRLKRKLLSSAIHKVGDGSVT
jgi:2-haloacid dehalogenase